MNELYARLRSEMPSPKSDQEAIAAAMQMIRRLETQSSAEEAVRVAAKAEVTMGNACHACGGENRPGNAFCGSCGVPLRVSPGEESAAKLAQPAGQHHYHHHYHHYGVATDGFAAPVGETRAAAPARPRAAVGGPLLSRAETAVRKLTQDWVQACNTRQLDDLVDLYAGDALVLRPNFPVVRGIASIREFFFAALDAGLGEVELEPVRTEVLGEVAFEAGRCKMLVPGATGKRREERGKYLVMMNRQAGGEWKVVADSWSSDLTLAVGAEPGAAQPISQNPGNPLLQPPRKRA